MSVYHLMDFRALSTPTMNLVGISFIVSLIPRLCELEFNGGVSGCWNAMDIYTCIGF